MKKFKRILAVMLSAIILMSFASCSLVDEDSTDITNSTIKIGVLLSSNQDDRTGTSGAANAAIGALLGADYGISGERFKYEENVDPNDAEAVASAIKRLVNFECSLIIATDAAYIDDVQTSANETDDTVKYLVFGAENDGKNIYGYSADITETAYLSGIVAAMKAQELQVPKLGFVVADEKDVSVLNAFAMGAKSVNDSVTVSAIANTDTVADTNKLIKEGCVVIASDFESEDIAKTATEANVFFCGFSSNTFASDVQESEESAKIAYSDYFLCAPTYNFTQFYINAIKAIVDSKEPAAFEGGYASGAVALSDLNDKTIAEGTQAAVDKAAAEIAEGKLVYDISAENLYDNVAFVK